MRKTLRAKRADNYWALRWANIPVDAPAQGHDRYPLFHADLVVGEGSGPILELGCGAGRLVRHYHERGLNIIGVDNIKVAIQKLKQCDDNLDVRHADATALPFADGYFSTVLCFGVYHSLENDVGKAIQETFRVLRPGGQLAAEFRSDSVHNWLIDKFKTRRGQTTAFHKWNYRCHEARHLLEHAGFVVELELPAINMPLLYHIPLLKHFSQREVDEHDARRLGYRLRPPLDKIHALGAKYLPDVFANEYIFICKKPLT
jgi:SAM-dependent methyltransferase